MEINPDQQGHSLLCGRWVAYDDCHKRYDPELACTCGSTKQDSSVDAGESNATAKLADIRTRRAMVRFIPADKARIEQALIHDCYRQGEASYWIGHTHPSAEFIANAPTDIDYLLSIIDSRTSNPATEELIAAAKEASRYDASTTGETFERLRTAIENYEKVK